MSKVALNKERLQFEDAVCFINIIYFELIHIIAQPSEVPPTAEEQPEQDILDKGKNNKSIMRIRKRRYKLYKYNFKSKTLFHTNYNYLPFNRPHFEAL